MQTNQINAIPAAIEPAQTTNVVSFSMSFKGGTYPPLVSIKTVNRMNGKVAYVMALLDTGCTGMIVSQRCVDKLKVSTW